MMRRAVAGFGRRFSIAGVVTVAVALGMSAGAAAATTPINIGTPYESGNPSVVVESSGAALVAWANTKDLAGANNFVQYCVVPAAGSACSESGSLDPADGGQYIDDVQTLDDDGTLVILADVYGTQGNSAEDYIPEQEWQSTDGGATWLDVDNGLSVGSGIINADTEPLNAIIVPGTNTLGFGWNTADGPPTFDAFPLTGPPECSVQTCPNSPYASLEPDTNPDTITNAGGNVASQGAAHPGVLAIYNTDFSNGPLGCNGSSSFGTAYAYGSGAQGSGNSYDVSPGSPGSAWRVAASQADCGVEYPVVGGGVSGFGVLEDNLKTNATVYHPFDQTHQNFDTPMALVSSQFEQQPALSQDEFGDIYATFLDTNSGDPTLGYSTDGGASWSAPVALTNTSVSGIGGLTSSVNAPGKGWAAWTNNGSVYALPFDAQDTVTPAAVSGSGSSTPTTVTVTITCATVPCTVTITITGSGSGVGSDLATAARKHRHRTVTLGSGKFTLRTAGAKKLTLKLSRAGKAFFRHHRRGRLTVSLTEQSLGVKKLTKRTVTVTLSKKHHHKH